MLKAGLPLPGPEYYDGYPQLENGVGLMACMREEFDAALACLDGYELTRPRKLSIATGEAAYDFICSLAGILMRRVPALDCRVYRVETTFSVTASRWRGLYAAVTSSRSSGERSWGRS